MTKRIALGAAFVLSGYIIAGATMLVSIAPAQLPTVESTFRGSGITDCTSDKFVVAVQVTDATTGFTVARLNMDNKWSTSLWGVLHAAWVAGATPWSRDEWRRTMFWLAASLPLLSTESFADGDAADKDPKYWRAICRGDSL